MNEQNCKVKCGSCVIMLDESPSIAIDDRKPCPAYGSISRCFEVNIIEQMTLRDKIGMKIKSPGAKKSYFESVSGDDLHHDTEKWYKLERVIDRKNNKYMEKIFDYSTGEVIRLCVELLTEHRTVVLQRRP